MYVMYMTYIEASATEASVTTVVSGSENPIVRSPGAVQPAARAAS